MHMMKTTSKACLLGLLLPILAQGQEAGLLRMNHDTAVSSTETALFGGVEEGKFRPTYAGTFQWNAGAEAKTVRHGKKTSWTGGISLQQMMGYNMGSSMLLNPGYFPVDVLDATEGTKSRQSGKLEGSFLTDLGYEWAIGLKGSAKVDYMTKPRDIKHASFGVDALLEPTLTYVMDDDMGLVSSYQVRARWEWLRITQREDGAQPFVDLGLRFGANENVENFPILEIVHGFNELLYMPELTAEFGLSWKHGWAGRLDLSRFRFPGRALHAGFGQTFQADKVDHVYHLAYRRDRDELREIATEGRGFDARYGRLQRNLDLKYEIRFLRGVVRRIGVDLAGNQWKEQGLMPLQPGEARWYDGMATLLTSFTFGPVDLDLNVLAAQGWWKDRGWIENVPVPGRMLSDWLQNMDYRTAPRIGVNGTITVRIPGVKGLYTQLDGSWLYAFWVVYAHGQNRETGMLRIGYKF